ncbi:MAG TPA: hypothetical protein VK009_11565, partial [Chloroflexota bacterium]|nr:hypothetical protein [Chloroflexota bacterium]
LVALAECCLRGNLGATMDGQPLDYFAETPSRIVVSTPDPEALAGLGVPCTRLGRIGGDRLTIPGLGDLAVSEMRQASDSGLEQALR